MITRFKETTPQSLLSRLHPLAAPIAVGVVAIAATAYIGSVNPHEAGHYPTCPSLYLTGTYCPGCGSLRAVHDLANGDLLGAIDMNVLAVVAAPYLLYSYVTWLLRSAGVPIRRRLAPPWVIYGVLAAIIVYWIARNIPALHPYLAP